MAERPPLQSNDTFDAPQLVGSISGDGIAALSARQDENSKPQVNVNGHLKANVGAKDFAARSKSESAVNDGDSDDTIEDYDQLELDPDTLVANSRQSMDESMRPAGSDSGRRSSDMSRRQSEPGAEGEKGKRRRSIAIKLEKTDKKGRYTLTADDPEVREILRKGLEREEQDTSGKKPRMRFRDLVFTRQFTTFDRQNPASSESPFFGFFTLFWLAMAMILGQVCLRNWRDHGSILGNMQIARMMFSHDVFLLGITDGVMFAATVEAFLLQKLVQKGWINWARSGWVIQNIWQSAYLGTVVWWTWYRSWPWSHSIFVLIHSLVFVMKQHSYAFYNGYLSSVNRRKTLLENKLKHLEDLNPQNNFSAPNSPTNERPSATTTGTDKVNSDYNLSHRPSLGPRTSTNLTAEKSDVATIASAIESGRSLDSAQFQAFTNVISTEITDLTHQLAGRTGKNPYPKNLRLGNYLEFICLPTLVYELSYPRQERINWYYVAEKTTATFGVLGIMMVISQGFIYPPVAKTVAMKEAGMTIEERWREFPFIVSEMLFPLLIEQLLTWYVIWECILNVLAEVTRFADRGFYGDWWNSVSWDQYARDWNRPVHNFLLRHVYHSSISTFHLSRNAATFVTFLLSALVHELAMAVLFKKVRGYLFTMQLLQMPLVTLSRTKLMKGRTVLGNVIFWLGLFVGPSFLTSLYLII